MFDIDKIRADFPILRETVYGRPLVYLDNAATTQKPQVVLDRIVQFYTQQNSNIHRGVHFLSEQASGLYESVRGSVRSFINAESPAEIVFTKGTTESINLVAESFGRKFVKAGDEIIITQMEHHSNIVPWQMLCENRGAKLKVVPVDENGKLRFDTLDELITGKTRLISLTYVSNALGVVNPIREVIDLAHGRDVPVLVDAAQAVQHLPLDVKELDCDFLVFSGHKMYAETGVGVLYGKEKWLEAMPPYQSGGGMISDVNLKRTTYAELPLKFEAGTGNLGAVMSLGAALEYLQTIGLSSIEKYENDLVDRAVERIGGVEGVVLYGSSPRCGIVSFNLGGAHSYDVGLILDKSGIAVRTGHHCAQPLMEHFGVSGTVRASFGLYNTAEEIEELAIGLQKARAMLCPEYSGAK